ncbi:MAG: nitroreductase family protein [Defluviitaleaceae bacterium]|nr:nitroreductase family protein [Defluviitaleaceae bacterium]
MIIDVIKNRRSIRKFKTTEVSREQVQTLLEAAMLAPSACNTRAWRFIVVTNRDVLNQLAEIHPYGKMLTAAPVCIVVVGLPALQEGHEHDLPKGFLSQDCGATTQNILLQAEAMGLGSCWCGVYPKAPLMKSISDILNIPPDEIPFNLIAIGEKDQHPEVRGKYEEEKVTWL